MTRSEENRMNKLKRASLYFVIVCTLVLVNAISAFGTPYDEWGEIHINDTIGGIDQEFLVTGTITTQGNPIGDATIIFVYDPEIMEFVGGAEGTEASAEEGRVTMFNAGTGTETSLEYGVIFRGLAEGTVNLTIVQYITWYFTGEVLMAHFNEAVVTITEEGAPDGGFVGGATGVSPEFEIKGTIYTIYDNITEAMIPSGFTKIQRDVRGSTHNAIMQDVSGIVFMYLVTGQNDPVLGMLDEVIEDFTLAGLMNLMDGNYIIILDITPGTTLPANFQPTTLDFNGTFFPVWQNMDATDFFLVYALNSQGVEGFYQYDEADRTFQRFIVPEIVAGEEVGDEEGGIAGGILGLIRDNLVIVLLAGALLVLFLLIALMVTSAKLRRRNAELDEVYSNDYDDRYDDDYDDYDDYDDDYDDDDYDDDDYDDDDYDDYDDDDRRDDKFDVNFVDV